MSSSPSIIPPLFLLVLVCSCQWPHVGGSCQFQFVEETCSQAAESSKRISYCFCLAALEEVPESCHADLNGLGIISAKLALLNATSIEHLILEMKAQTNGSHTDQALDQCLESYSDAISNLEESINAFTFSSSDDANVYLSAAMTDSGDCEGGFEDLHLVFPLTGESKDFTQLCAIALAITKLA